MIFYKIIRQWPLVALLACLAACELLDPTEVKNPNLTDESFVGTPNSTTAWLNGLERQFSITVNTIVVATEIVSDNYFNNQSAANKSFDIPDLFFADPDIANLQLAVSRLRSMAEYGLERIAPNDTDATALQIAEFHFYKGMAHLFMAELFVDFPAQDRGPAIAPAEHLALAVAGFETALRQAVPPARQTAYRLALARAHYRAGNASLAEGFAAQVLEADPQFTAHARFDRLNGLINSMQTLIFRNAQNDYQPLPRLDFLDPKYSGISNTFDDSICVQKAEEARLILAEALLARNDLAGAQAQLRALLELVANRPIRQVDDRNEQRGVGGIRSDYPDSASFRVAASPDDTLRAGLVLTRSQGPVPVPIVSGTSVTGAIVDALASADQALEVLYLMRQEIFLAEGRRMTDLGIRFPVSEREQINNPNIGNDLTQPLIPAFIPRNAEMNDFTTDAAAQTVVIRHNMNRVLVANKASGAVLPFH